MVARLDYSVSEDEARELRCPKCKVSKGDKCIYLTHSKGWSVLTVGYRPNGTPIHEAVCHIPGIPDRFGQPMDAVHVERRDLVRASWRKRQPEPVNPISDTHRSAFTAMAEFSRREYMDLRTWLSEYYWILTGTVPDVGRASRYLEHSND